MNYNCDDFGTANPAHAMGVLTASASVAADRRDLPSYMRNAFMQGYIHAARGDNPAPGDNFAYGLGYRAGEIAVIA